MINQENIGELAHSLAGDIYSYSKQALMAHSVRAVKEHLRKKYQMNHYAIVVNQSSEILTRYRRNSWVVFGANSATIFVDQSLGHDETRVCIAHELFHILFSFEPGVEPHRFRGRLMEDACDVFANELCERHDAFYKDPTVIDTKCRFHNLPIYSIPRRDFTP